MIRQFQIRRGKFIALAFFVLLQACVRLQVAAPSTLPPIQDISTVTTQEPVKLPATSTPRVVPSTATQTRFPSTQLPTPKIIITAIKGNLFIRRGPDMAFNPIGVLYKGTKADVIGRDVLTKWVQVIIPNSKNTGWISIQTVYSKVEGDISSLPDFTPTVWPVAAYLRNCTYHEMYILPGEITLPSSLGYPENEIWLYPGRYTVYDLDLPDYPAVLDVDIREGSDVEILIDGLGEKRKCP